MRLIDGKALADEILGEIFERGQASCLWEKQLEIGAITYRDIEFADGYDNALEDIYRRLNNAPTVKAIPIAWINKWVITTNMGAGRTIDRLLEDWETENESTRSDI